MSTSSAALVQAQVLGHFAAELQTVPQVESTEWWLAGTFIRVTLSLFFFGMENFQVFLIHLVDVHQNVSSE